jgi:hypothetical protein
MEGDGAKIFYRNGKDGEDGEDVHVEEVYDASQPTQRKRTTNYTNNKENAGRSLESVTLDVVTSNNQTGKWY